MLLHDLPRVQQGRSPEVDDLERRVLVRALVEDVLGLQVPVHDLVAVAVVDRQQDLGHHLRRLLLAEGAGLDYAVEELAPRAELGHYVEEVLVDEVLEHLDNMRVVLMPVSDA